MFWNQFSKYFDYIYITLIVTPFRSSGPLLLSTGVVETIETSILLAFLVVGYYVGSQLKSA